MLSWVKELRNLSVASSILLYINEEEKQNGKHEEYGGSDTEFSRLVNR